MTFKADIPVGRYYIVPNSLVVGYDKTIVFRDRHSNPVFTLPNGGKLLVSDGHRAEPKVYTCRFIDQAHFKLAAKGEGSWPYHHDQFVERMESMRGCTYRPEKGYLRFLMWGTHKRSNSHSRIDVCRALM